MNTSNLKKSFVVLVSLVVIIATASFSFFEVTHAQSAASIYGIKEEIDMNVSPKNPQPGQDITATLEAPGINLDTASISWSVNGVTKKSGTGIKTFTTASLPLGKTTTIRVSVTPVGGPSVSKTYTVSAQNVDIIYEAQSYTPPFYKGKSLYGQEGEVLFVAIPNLIGRNGAKIDPSNVAYKWTVDDTVLGDKSGYGRNSLSYSGSILAKETKIQVDVSAADGTTGQSIILITPQSPQTVLYENSPLYGVLFNSAITDDYVLKDKEVRVEAFPYFQSANSKTDYNLSYSWLLNNDPISTPPQKNSAVFRNTTGEKGVSRISVTVDNSTHALQQAEVSASLSF